MYNIYLKCKTNPEFSYIYTGSFCLLKYIVLYSQKYITLFLSFCKINKSFRKKETKKEN